MSKSTDKLNFNSGRCLLEFTFPQQNSNSKPRFSTWTKFHDFMDRFVFSTKYKTKDEYSLRASNNLRPLALQEELVQEKILSPE